MMSFDEDTAVRAAGPGGYSCEVSPNHWVVAGPNGGYLAALLARAGEEHLADRKRQLRSLTVHYLRPPKAGSAQIEVTTEQLGRSVAFLRLTMIQGEKAVLLATGAWSTEREGFVFDSWTKPQADAPESCSTLSAVRGTPSLPIHQQWDIRSATGAVFGSGQPPDLSWWIRPPIHRALDAPMIAAIADALPPPIFVTEVGPMAIPTIDLTIHIRAELAMVRWEPGDWVLARFSTRYASAGFLEEDGELWTADGTLLAHSRQLALSI
jgi:acyl-CoA thioesterase